MCKEKVTCKERYVHTAQIWHPTKDMCKDIALYHIVAAVYLSSVFICHNGVQSRTKSLAGREQLFRKYCAGMKMHSLMQMKMLAMHSYMYLNKLHSHSATYPHRVAFHRIHVDCT